MERHYNDLSYTIPYHLLRDNTRNIAVLHAYTRKRGLERTVIQRRARKSKYGQKRKKEKKRKEEKRSKKLHTCAQGAGRVPRGQGCCLLAQSVLCYVHVMDQQKDGTRPDGRQEKKERKEESSDTELEKPNQHFYVQPVGQRRHRDRREGRDNGVKKITIIMKRKNKD